MADAEFKVRLGVPKLLASGSGLGLCMDWLEIVFTALGLALVVVTWLLPGSDFLRWLRGLFRRKAPSPLETRSPKGAEGSSILDEIRRSKTLRVGCLHYPPFVDATDKNGAVTAFGIYPAMIDTIARQNGLAVAYSRVRWDHAIDAIKNREVDVVACVLQSASRRKACDFAGYADVKIAVTKGEIGWDYAVRYLGLEQDQSRFIILEATRLSTAMGLVLSEQVDVALADALTCAQFLKGDQAAGLIDAFASGPLNIEDNSLMIAQGHRAFREWLNTNLRWARESPAVAQLELDAAQTYSDVLVRIPL